MASATCKLCRKSGDLRKSHFMPRSLYALCRTEDYEAVRITPDVMLPTSRQTVDRLLCHDCEQLLSRDGEAWVLPLLANINGSFPLRERLLEQGPISDLEGIKVYSTASNPNIDSRKIAHFAAGLFWKAAAHSWRGGEHSPRINLREQEQESLRLFLLEDRALRDELALTVAVDASALPLVGVLEPFETECPNLRNFLTYIPGLLMNLYVGENAQMTFANVCITSNPILPILSAQIARNIRDTFRELASRPRKPQILLDTVAEIENRGLSIRLGDEQ